MRRAPAPQPLIHYVKISAKKQRAQRSCRCASDRQAKTACPQGVGAVVLLEKEAHMPRWRARRCRDTIACVNQRATLAIGTKGWLDQGRMEAHVAHEVKTEVLCCTASALLTLQHGQAESKTDCVEALNTFPCLQPPVYPVFHSACSARACVLASHPAPSPESEPDRRLGTPAWAEPNPVLGRSCADLRCPLGLAGSALEGGTDPDPRTAGVWLRLAQPRGQREQRAMGQVGTRRCRPVVPC